MVLILSLCSKAFFYFNMSSFVIYIVYSLSIFINHEKLWEMLVKSREADISDGEIHISQVLALMFFSNSI